MPQRTNDFQELFFLIQHALGQPGDKITASAMVRVVGLETEREIDLLVESSTGIYRIKLAVEVKDESRPMDLETFDGYIGKYFGKFPVVVDKVVMVARHGFSKGVVEKARLLGVPLLTLQEAKDFNWASFPQHLLFTAPISVHLKLCPLIREITYNPPLKPRVEEIAMNKGQLFSPEGLELGTPIQVAQDALTKESPGQESLFKQAEQKVQEAKVLNGTFPISIKDHTLVIGDKRYKVNEMRVRFLTADAVMQTKCSHYEMEIIDGKTQIIHHFEADIGSDIVEWVVPDGLNAKQISINIKKKKAK